MVVLFESALETPGRMVVFRVFQNGLGAQGPAVTEVAQNIHLGVYRSACFQESSP